MLNFKNKREIYRVYTAHTIHSVALSLVSIYIPIYLLVQGFSLAQVILFYIIYHGAGLLFVFLGVVPLMNRAGLLRTFKLHYPLIISFFILLNLLPYFNIPIFLIAVIGGMASFTYWVPLNILLIKYSAKETMGSDLSKFLAFPKLFRILGPLSSALFIPLVGFWFVFLLAFVGLIASYLPLARIRQSAISVHITARNIFSKLRERKKLFFLEGLDNILEESEWFWAIFVYVIIGSLSSPGIVGGLEALGGAVFTLIIGKLADRKDKKLVFWALAGIIMVWSARFFISSEWPAYLITVVASFVMTAFLVSYFSVIYREVKNKKEEEFLILREIPTVLGRIVVFGTILLSLNNLRVFFFLPIALAIILMVALAYKNRLESKKAPTSVSQKSPILD